MVTASVEPTRETLHGSFSREFTPVLTIDSGESVQFSTLIASWTLDLAQDPPRKFEPRDAQRDSGHALCGPIAIRGAQPGMTLEVQINEVRPARWGQTNAGGWENKVNRSLDLIGKEKGDSLHWTLDPDAMTGQDQYGHSVALHPFMGVMGLPPDEPGIHSTIPPRWCGGNIDCKELVAGSTLYLPIAVPQALFSVGDGHGVQGDGEVCGVALECPMERVDLTFTLNETMRITTPHALTKDGWITLGFHTDLHEASLIALKAMLDLMQKHYQLSKAQALGLASLVVDLRVTQIANGTLGIHAFLPHGAIK